MNRYNAQSMTQLVETLQQLTQQQTRAREQYSPSTPQAAAPQTPFQGLLSGVIGEHNRRREDVKLQEDAALKQSLAILDLIPDTPENTPKKLQLLTSILHPKTQKGWKEVWNPQADHTAQAQFLQKFAAQLPTDDEVMQQQGQAPASRVRSVAEQGEGYVPPSGKFQFPDDGQFQGGQIIQTADGLVLVTFDKKTGEPKLKPLGQGKTEKQTVAEIRGKGGAGDPTVRNEVSIARRIAQREGFDYTKLPDEEQAVYIGKARDYLARLDEAKLKSTELNVPLKTSQVAVNQANARRGGVTGGQAETIKRQDTQDQLRAKEDVTKFEAELGKFQTEMNGIWNGWKNGARKKINGQLVAVPDGELENYMKLVDPDGYARYNKLKAEITSAKTSLQGAQERAKVVGKATPRGGGSGGRSLTGNLDIDRIMRNAPPSTGAPGGEHYVVQDPTAAQLRVPAGFNLDTESTPETTTGLRSVGRSFNNPNVFIMNPARFGLRPTSLVKGARLDTEKGVFEVMDVSADKTKVLVHKIPE